MPKKTPLPAGRDRNRGVLPNAPPGAMPRPAGDLPPAPDPRSLPPAGSPVAGARPTSSWAARYGQVILRDGIATIPRALYLYQAALDLAAPEVWLASAVLAHKWDADLPHPSLRQMAAETGVSLRQLQNLRAALCSKELLAVYARRGAQGGQQSNSYDFGGLFTRLERAIQSDPAAANAIQADGGPALPVDAGDTSFVARYGRVIAHAGLIAVPAGLYTHQAALGLRPQAVWFVTYILSYRWSTDLPYPSLRKMAARTGYSEQRLHEIKGELEAQGYLRVVARRAANGGQDSNAYDFSGLLEALTARLQPAVAVGGIVTAALPATPGPRHPRRGRARTVSAPGRPDNEGQAQQQGEAAPVQKPLVSPMQSPSVPPVQSLLATPMQTRLWGAGQIRAADGSGDVTDRLGDAEKWRDLDAEEVDAPDAERFSHPHAESLCNLRAESMGEPRAESLRQRRSDQKESDQKEDSNRATRVKTQQDENAPITYSPYVAGIVLDYSRELGDPGHGPANVRQTLRLWQASTLGETGFVELLHESRRRVRYYQGAQGQGSIANKMAYFFRVLESLVYSSPDESSGGEGEPLTATSMGESSRGALPSTAGPAAEARMARLSTAAQPVGSAPSVRRARRGVL